MTGVEEEEPESSDEDEEEQDDDAEGQEDEDEEGSESEEDGEEVDSDEGKQLVPVRKYCEKWTMEQKEPQNIFKMCRSDHPAHVQSIILAFAFHS